MFNYEYGKAALELDEIKDKLRAYLLNSYEKDKNPEKLASETFKYLENIVNRVIKKQSYKFKFNSGGSPGWHGTIFSYMSRWIKAELKMCDLLSKELDNHIDIDGADETERKHE